MLRRALLTLWFFLPFTYCVTIAAAHPAGSLPPGQLHMENRAPSTALSDTPVLPDTPVQPLRMVIQTLETASGYRFLYRDALVAGVRIRFEFNENWKDALKKELRAAGLDLVINERRKQIVIFPAGDAGDAGYAREIISMKPLRGYVIDEQTGERLPFATVIRIVSKEQEEQEEQEEQKAFRLNGDTTSIKTAPIQLQGTQADLQGRFRLDVPIGEDMHLRISYIGYQTVLIAVSAEELPALGELAVRLEPAPYEGKEIIVQAPVMQQQSGSGTEGGLIINGFSPLGESNAIRMLQTLPSVGMGTALSDGAFVRGSNSDALQVLLDGAVIYNQSHLFGLVDSFNADVIRTSSFYYDVTPARYQGPPGGTLSLVTRAGSLYRYRGSAGISSSALNGSLEGPVLPGRASVLVSGRTSLLDGYGFPGTEELVAWGLNVARPNSLDNGTVTLEDRIVAPGDFTVAFHDLHGKLFLEDTRGNRWMLSGYSGFNNTHQDALRLVRSRPVSRDAPLVRENFETRNRWGNRSANLGWFRTLDPDRSMHVRSGISYYHTRYLKEDFPYQRPGRNLQDQLLFIHPYENRSELTHWYVEADLIGYPTFGQAGRQRGNGVPEATTSGFLPPLVNVQSGLALHGYHSAYLEESLNRPRYYQKSTPLLLEGYLDTEWKAGEAGAALPMDLQGGIRIQYFSDGGYVRLSPRIRADLFTETRVSASLGYSRTYQYLYKLAFYNQTTSDIWITANEHQKPAAVDLWSVALRTRIARHWFFRTEVYYKYQRNLRFHEINIQSVQSPLEGAPWFADNTGHARGVEFQAGRSGNRLSLTQSYTLSRAKLSNPRLNEGDRFLAYWDRTHQFNTLISLRLFTGFRLDGNWFYATGVPDRLDLFRSGDTRLGMYSRIDLSARYEVAAGSHRWVMEAGVYNLTNRKNPWYKDWVLAVEQEMQQRRLEPVQVVFYDLGFQPSFSLRYFLDP